MYFKHACTKNCSHLQTYDLESLIGTLPPHKVDMMLASDSKSSPFKCPLCGLRGPLTLASDIYETLNRCSLDVETLRVNEHGEVVPLRSRLSSASAAIPVRGGGRNVSVTSRCSPRDGGFRGRRLSTVDLTDSPC